MHQDIIENFCSLARDNVHPRPAQFCNKGRHVSIHMIIEWFIVYNINVGKVINTKIYKTSYRKGYDLHHTQFFVALNSLHSPNKFYQNLSMSFLFSSASTAALLFGGLQSISSALTSLFPSGLTSLFTVLVSCTSRGYSLCTGLHNNKIFFPFSPTLTTAPLAYP